MSRRVSEIAVCCQGGRCSLCNPETGNPGMINPVYLSRMMVFWARMVKTSADGLASGHERGMDRGGEVWDLLYDLHNQHKRLVQEFCVVLVRMIELCNAEAALLAQS